MTDTTVRTYDVPDISCDHCKATIESALADVDGITTAEVDVPSRRVRVEGAFSDDTVRSTLEDVGYEVAGTS